MFFLIYFSLFVEKLPKHPGYSKAPATDRSRVKKLLKSSFEKAMELKEKLKMKYEQERNDYIQQKKIEVSITVYIHNYNTGIN